MRNIIIPTDFSENAFNALKYACQAFKYERAKINVVHAYADEVYQRVQTSDRSALEENKQAVFQESEGSLNEIISAIRDYSPNPGHEINKRSVFATLTDAINDLVKDEDADVVVMGTRGETNDRTVTLGTNTLQVLKYVQCPVLAVPTGYAFKAPKEILFPTNYLIPYKRRELKLLCEMADSYRATIHMLYLDPLEHPSLRQEDNMRFLKECLYKPKLRFETGPQGEKAGVILDYIEKGGIELLVMVNSRHTYTEDMLYTSTINKLGRCLKVPFLVMQNLAR